MGDLAGGQHDGRKQMDQNQLDPKLESIREDILAKVNATEDPQAEADRLLRAAGVDAEAVSQLEEGMPPSLAFYLGHEHAVDGSKSIKELEAETQKEINDGKSKSDLMTEAGLDPAWMGELDGTIQHPEVAFLIGYRFNKEKVAA